MGKTVAETSWRIKAASAVGAKDWPRVQQVYGQYGTYLELIGGEAPAEQPVVVEREIDGWIKEPF